MVKYATNRVSLLKVKVRGLSVLWSLQWLNLYPGLAVAETTAVGAVQVGVTNTETIPIVVSAEMAENGADPDSIKFEK